MKRPGNFIRPNRIEEEAENFEDSSSSEDYEGQLIPAPLPKTKSSNLFDAELMAKASGSTPDSDDGLGEDEDGAGGADEGEDDDVVAGAADREELIRERIGQAQEQMKHLLELFDDDQLRRYETFRRVGFPRQAIKKLMIRVLDQQVNQNSIIVVAGIAKVFVGELVEESRRVLEEIGETGPIQPSHLLEAQRRLKAAGLGAGSSIHRRPRNRLL